MCKVEDAAKKLGVSVFELFARARNGYGGPRDSARNAFNKFQAFAEIPHFVASFIAAHEGRHDAATYWSGPRPALTHGGSPRRLVG